MLEPVILTEVSETGWEQRQINQLAEAGRRNVSRPGLCEEGNDPAKDGGKSELHDGDQDDVDGLTIMGGGDDVQCEKYTAD